MAHMKWRLEKFRPDKKSLRRQTLICPRFFHLFINVQQFYENVSGKNRLVSEFRASRQRDG